MNNNLWFIQSSFLAESAPPPPFSLELSQFDLKVHLLQLPPAGGGGGRDGGRDADHFAASFYTRNHGKWGQIVWWRALWCIMGGGRRIRYQQGTDTTGVLHMVRNWKPPIIHGRHAPWNDSAGNRLRLSKITKNVTVAFVSLQSYTAFKLIIIIIIQTIIDKQNKYQEMANEICAMRNQKVAQVIPIVISSTGVIPKSLSQSLTRLNLHPNSLHNCKNL